MRPSETRVLRNMFIMFMLLVANYIGADAAASEKPTGKLSPPLEVTFKGFIPSYS